MAPRKNPLKLNKLQLRTLALAHVLARDQGRLDEATGEVTLSQLPHPHGDHVHVGDLVVSAREASGFANPAVWNALARKDLVRIDDAAAITVTALGMTYDTGLADRLIAPSDH